MTVHFAIHRCVPLCASKDYVATCTNMLADVDCEDCLHHVGAIYEQAGEASL